MAGREGKITKYRKPVNINLGMIIFGCVFVYLIICVVMYFRAGHVVGYEVQTGSLSVDSVYKALAIRDEEIFNARSSGYISYYAREGTRVAVGDLVYTIDETGKFSDSITGSGEENTLTNEDLSGIKSHIMSFSSMFEPNEFSTVYDFKYSLEGTMMQLGSYQGIQAISDASAQSNLLNIERAPKTGIIIYSTDGYEDITPESVNSEVISPESYERKPMMNNGLVNSGDPAFKISLSEHWSLMIPVDAEEAERLKEAEYVRVKFLRTQQYSWGEVTIHNNDDGIYAELGFNNSMVTFCGDRFVDIELETEEKTGLKIPNSAIAEREFFLVPTDYVVKGGPSGNDGVYREVFNEEGQASSEFVNAPVYSERDGDYYLDNMSLRIGDYIIHPETGERYAISRRNTLIGVYNINKGYADFKEINILYQNDEYSVVESGTAYGLSVYDYIALDADSVEEFTIINE